MGRSFNPAGGGSTPFEGQELLAPFVCPTLGASVNDYLVPQKPAFLNASVLVLSATTAVTITGLQGWAPYREVTLLNNGASTLTLPSNNAGSAVKNRFQFGLTALLAQGDGITLLGLPQGGWAVLGVAPSAGSTPAPATATYVTGANETATLANSLQFGVSAAATPAGTFLGASVYATAQTVLTSTNPTPLAMGAVDFDTGAPTPFWGVGEPTRLTAPVAGFYLASGSIIWNNGLLAAARGVLAKNGNYSQASLYGFSASSNLSPTGNSNPGNVVTYVFDLAAGDYLELLAWSEDTAGTVINLGRCTGFNMVRLG